MTTDVKPLPTTFRKDGFTFEQMDRRGDWAIFWKTKSRWNAGYEVVRIRSHDGFTIAGKTFPPAETYPVSEKWGVDGFSCNTLDRAREKLTECLKRDCLSVKQATPEGGA